MTWEEYYEGFWDWSLGTKKSYTYRLSGFGPADEVFDVVLELAYEDSDFAAQFVKKALAAGVRFTPENVLDMVFLIDESVLSQMAELTIVPFNREQLQEIHTLIDDKSFERISRKANIADVSFDEPVEESDTDTRAETGRPKHPGFFTTFLSVMAAESLLRGLKPKRHNGRCSGDCANCPPHYGYRYGRWYYGQGHTHGCEFGGNKGDGN